MCAELHCVLIRLVSSWQHHFGRIYCRAPGVSKCRTSREQHSCCYHERRRRFEHGQGRSEWLGRSCNLRSPSTSEACRSLLHLLGTALMCRSIRLPSLLHTSHLRQILLPERWQLRLENQISITPSLTSSMAGLYCDLIYRAMMLRISLQYCPGSIHTDRFPYLWCQLPYKSWLYRASRCHNFSLGWKCCHCLQPIWWVYQCRKWLVLREQRLW